MSKNYNPAEVEPRMLNLWMDGDYYRRNDGKGDVTIAFPPPNVTGKLHMGHALNDTIQDTFMRFKRMEGFSTRGIVGTDHAGIATQTKVDKRLAEQGINRREIGREKFLDACQQWREEYGGTIIRQFKRMGVSADFKDEKFTMDPDYAQAVRKTFVDWYHDDLIYRGKRIVNWCPNCTTAIADDEVEYEDETGHLWYLRYPLAEPVNGQDYIVVATTRPETMLGDTGVAVSPKDPAMAPFVGKMVNLPLTDRQIPIFSDFFVDAGFGTGFVKVTPAHDPNDWAMGERNGLERINIFDEHANVVEDYGEFTGMSRDELREAIVAKFEELDLIDHIDDHKHSVGHCYRCHTTLEPWESEQWFVAVDRLKKPATKVVEDGSVRFHPERWKTGYLSWMENLKDWCISRQLWWGHQIPVFYCDECGWQDASMEDIDVCPTCGKSVHRDEDVLDTWFSSQLWTFATQGWPQDSAQLEGHHPTTILSTARDIIALWVARMVMSSEYFLNEVPFTDVIIHPTVLAKDGSRMSKSKGNGIDPIDLIEEYGADAMRFGLLMFVTNNQDVKFDSDKISNSRAFATKIWNASRFVLSNMEGYVPGEPKAVTVADKWMFSRLAKQSAYMTEGLDGFEFGDIARSIYSFTWNEFCDWYIEFSKPRLQGTPEERLQAQRNLVYVLDATLRMLHPAMPFITEEIWAYVPHVFGDRESDVLMMAQWPEPEMLSQWIDDGAEHDFELIRAIVGGGRSARARYRLSPKTELEVTVRASAPDTASLNDQSDTVMSLGRISKLTVAQDAVKPKGSVMSFATGIEIYTNLEGLVDFAEEHTRVEGQLAKAQKEQNSLSKTLNNPGFISKAAPEIIEAKQARAAELVDEISAFEAMLADFAAEM